MTPELLKKLRDMRESAHGDRDYYNARVEAQRGELERLMALAERFSDEYVALDRIIFEAEADECATHEPLAARQGRDALDGAT